MVSTRGCEAAARLARHDHQPTPSTSTGGGRVTRHNSAAGVTLVNAGYDPGYPKTTASESGRPKELMDLPPELMEKILSYLTFKNICQLRLVNTRFDAIAKQMLNSTFSKLQHQMGVRFQTIRNKMPRRESARRNHPMACESDIIETIHMRLTLLQMSFGKHIERKHCCFFPGEILDEVFNILHYIKVTPKLSRPYKTTDELFDLSSMAMEYFKEKIEPDLPEIAYFQSTDFYDFTSFPSKNSLLALDSSPLAPEEVKSPPEINPVHEEPQQVVAVSPEFPQSNMVLRKRIKKIKAGMKRYNNQLSMLKQDLRLCKRKTLEQQRQIAEQQQQLAEQQKQALEYTTRLDEYDKKNEEISRKFSTMLQELNKCKTELQYWRSKSPATPPFCTGCGGALPAPPEDPSFHEMELEAFILEQKQQAASAPEVVEQPEKPDQLEPEKMPKSPKVQKRKLDDDASTPIANASKYRRIKNRRRIK